MNLLRIQAFLTVADTGNISRAAAQLEVAQSVISRRIKALEAELGCRLFERTGRGVRMTEAAQALAPRLSGALDSMRVALGDAAETSGQPTGLVRLGVVPSAARPLVGLLYRRVATSYPRIALQFVEGFSNTLEEQLASGELDLAIINRYGRARRRGEETIAVVDSHVIGPPRAFRRANPAMTLAELARRPLVLAARPNGLRVELDQICRRHGVTLQVVVESDSMLVMKDLAVQAGLCTLLPRQAVHEELEHGLLSAARLASPTLPRRLSLLVAGSGTRSLGVRTIAKLIKELADSAPVRQVWR